MPFRNKETLVAIVRLQEAIARSQLGSERTMQVIVEHARALTPANGAVLELVDGDTMVYRAAAGTLADHVGRRVPRSASPDSPDTVSVPILYKEHAIGALRIVCSQASAFRPEDITIVELLADVLSRSLHHERLYETMVFDTLHDSVTGLLNRRAFDADLRDFRGRPYSIVMFDLDIEGDEALRGFADMLETYTRDDDRTFRLGGKGLAILMPDTSPEIARTVASRIAAAARLGKGIRAVRFSIAKNERADLRSAA